LASQITGLYLKQTETMFQFATGAWNTPNRLAGLRGYALQRRRALRLIILRIGDAGRERGGKAILLAG